MSGGLWPFIITEKTCFDCRHIRSRLPLRRNTSRITCKFTNDHEQNEKGRIDPQRKASPSLTKSVKLLPVPSRPFILGEAKRNESSPVTYPLDPFIWDSAVTFQKKKTYFSIIFLFRLQSRRLQQAHNFRVHVASNRKRVSTTLGTTDSSEKTKQL